MWEPSNCTDTREHLPNQVILGMVTYYLKFLPNLADTLSPLYALLRKGAKWSWSKNQDDAYKHVKNQLSSPVALTTFDPDKELLLQCDASRNGLGLVLAHKESDGVSDQLLTACAP